MFDSSVLKAWLCRKLLHLLTELHTFSLFRVPFHLLRCQHLTYCLLGQLGRPCHETGVCCRRVLMLFRNFVSLFSAVMGTRSVLGLQLIRRKI